MLSIHDLVAVDAYCRPCRIDRHHLKQFRNAFYKRRDAEDDALRELPEEQRLEFSSNVDFHFLHLHSRDDSRLDGASKLVFRTAHGFAIETVILRIATGRTALCVSTQAGCAARCRFCATGGMGLVQNLTASEILDQVVQANRRLQAENRRVRNVVFMGMGEPFHNEEALYQAIEVLCSPRCFDFAPKRLLVSTVGIPDAMVRCANRFPRIGLALSLHSARQEMRERIIPVAKRYRLDELREALRAATSIQRQPVMIEYLMLAGLNDSATDVQALTEYLSEIPVHINLIPYNAIDGAPELNGTPPAGRRAFAAELRAAGFTVTVRYSLGSDIAAACGQLARRGNSNC